MTQHPTNHDDSNDSPVTRAWILENYRVRITGAGTPFQHTYIMNPGKFEGEPIFAPYFYELALQGDGEMVQDGYRFHVEPEDLVEFPELAGIKTVELQYSDNGFVFCITCDDSPPALDQEEEFLKLKHPDVPATIRDTFKL